MEQSGLYDLTPDKVTIFGRTLTIAGALWLGWSGSGVAFSTNAGEVKADILGVSTTNAPTDFAYLGVFIDGSLQLSKRFEVRRDLRTYELFRNPDGGVHTIRLVKLTEDKHDKVALSVIRADQPILPAPVLAGESGRDRNRNILFIGDSITAGYGVLGEHSVQDDPAAYVFTTREEDVTKTASWLCARMLGAAAQYVCWSGNGIISRYIEPDSDIPITDDLMPSLLPYVDKNGEQVAKIYLRAHGWKDPAGAPELTPVEQDQTGFVPDIVVCNLGTNDSTFTKGIKVREQHFGQKYLEMLRLVQRTWPDARILIAYGMMETSLSDTCNEVALMGDWQYLQLPLMDPATDGIGGGGHPSINSHRLAAEVLAAKIHEMMGWERQN